MDAQMSNEPFSIRVGARQVPVLGLREIPNSLRIGLWNTFAPWLLEHTMFGDEPKRRFQGIYSFHATNWPVDEAYSLDHVRKRLKKWFMDEAPWYSAYDFVQGVPDLVWHGLDNPNIARFKQDNPQGYQYAMGLIRAYESTLNAMLARHGAPYQYRDGLLLPVTNEHELAEISLAIEQLPFADARTHVETAAQLLSARPEPDYRNSIKESISAVESLLWDSIGHKGEKMIVLLNEFEKKYAVEVHEAFKQMVVKLYGWTSDDSGVRHGISGEVTVGHTEARFALVMCSALVNFLAQKTASGAPAVR
jgi:hypothetical protein